MNLNKGVNLIFSVSAAVTTVAMIGITIGVTNKIVKENNLLKKYRNSPTSHVLPYKYMIELQKRLDQSSQDIFTKGQNNELTPTQAVRIKKIIKELRNVLAEKTVNASKMLKK